MPAVLRIERQSFEHPWDEFDFTATLRNLNAVGVVSEMYGAVVGYAMTSSYDEHIHLESLAVDPALRRLGIGSELVASIKARLSQQTRRRICTSVREKNLDAQLFLRECGFIATGVLKGEYGEYSDEDAYYFEFFSQ